jgi:hypothetical protein
VRRTSGQKSLRPVTRVKFRSVNSISNGLKILIRALERDVQTTDRQPPGDARPTGTTAI